MQHRLASLYNTLDTTHAPLATELLGTLLTQTLFFWAPSLLFLLLSFLPASLHLRLKTQPTQPPPTLPLLLHCARTVVLNQLLSAVLQSLLHLLFTHLLSRPPYTHGPAPSPSQIFRELALLLPSCELLFYGLHRALHSRTLYRRVHAVHHTFTAPVALAAQYAHPLEHAMTYFVPVFVPAACARVHVLTLWAWVACVCAESCVLHSGVRVGSAVRWVAGLGEEGERRGGRRQRQGEGERESGWKGVGMGWKAGLAWADRMVERHDRHHERGRNAGGYGTFWVSDWVFGTEVEGERKDDGRDGEKEK